jgi:hypothetical protein
MSDDHGCKEKKLKTYGEGTDFCTGEKDEAALWFKNDLNCSSVNLVGCKLVSVFHGVGYSFMKN